MESLLTDTPSGISVEEGYEQCVALAQSHYENFTIVSWFLPKELRNHLYAIYAFCRTVDDLGDEHSGDRLAALDLWEEDLRRCYSSSPHHPFMVALQSTIDAHDIPEEPFLKLIEANRLDQRNKRQPTYEDLEFYCRHSANPVGHLVLYVSGYRDEERQRLSDSTCTALQLANFWQDVARDYAMGRIYIPKEDMAEFGYTEEMLRQGTVNQAFRTLMAFEVDRARGLFTEGLKLVDTLQGSIKLDLALFSKGGMRVLDLIEAQNYDVLTTRPSLTKAAKVRFMLETFLKLKLFGRV